MIGVKAYILVRWDDDVETPQYYCGYFVNDMCVISDKRTDAIRYADPQQSINLCNAINGYLGWPCFSIEEVEEATIYSEN